MTWLKTWPGLLTICVGVSAASWGGALFLGRKSPDAVAPSASSQAGDGQAVMICFKRQESIWVAVRATPDSRVKGWTEGITSPVLVVYPQRGFNPVFTGATVGRVVWLDGPQVVGLVAGGDATADAGRSGHLSPPQEVTAAILLPPGAQTQVQAGDFLNLLEPGT